MFGQFRSNIRKIFVEFITYQCELFVKTPLILYYVLLFPPELFLPIITLIIFQDFFKSCLLISKGGLLIVYMCCVQM